MPSSGKSSRQTVRNSAKHLRFRFRRHHQQCPDSRIWKSPRILFQGQCETEGSYQRLSSRSNHPLELRSDASSLLSVGPGLVQYVPTIGPSYTGRETAMLDHVMLETHSLAYIAVHQFRQSGSWKVTDEQLVEHMSVVVSAAVKINKGTLFCEIQIQSSFTDTRDSSSLHHDWLCSH
jgi:hypothetical protein